MRTRWLVMAILALVAVRCSPSGMSVASPVLPDPDAPLVAVLARGGECPAGMCELRTTITRSGLVVIDGGGQRSERRLAAEDVARLGLAVETAEYAAILSRPFTDTCPMAYDGQELVYSFFTSRGRVDVASCKVAIDPSQSPFSVVATVLRASG